MGLLHNDRSACLENKSAHTETLSVAMIGSRGFDVRQSGLETHVRELAKMLGARGHHVTVYGRRLGCFARIPQSELGNANVEAKDGLCSRGKFTATTINTIWATIDALRSRRFQVLHYHGIGCVFAILFAKMSKLPVVLTLHSTNWEEKKWSRLSGWMIHRLECVATRTADAVIAVSDSIGARSRDEYGVESSVTAPGSGVFLQEDLGRDRGILESLGLQKDRYVLFVGRLIQDKGCHTLLEAHKKAGLPVKLIFTGPVMNEAYYRSLRENADESVVFAGIRQDDELGALYRHAWVFCMASMTEGLPIALIDALAHGCRCLASDIPSHRQLITDPGLRFPAEDVSALSARLLELRSHIGKQDAVARTDAGLQWLQQCPEYTFEAVADQVLDVYGKVMG